MQSMFNRLRDETSLHRSNGKATTSHLPVSVQQASDIEMDDIFIQKYEGDIIILPHRITKSRYQI